MVKTSDFSGLMSSAWALARAAAIVPIVSLERCTATLHRERIEADCTRLRTSGPDAVADGFLCIFRHQRFQLGFRSFMIQKGLPCAAEQAGKLRPRIRSTHVDDPHRLDPWLGRLDAE